MASPTKNLSLPREDIALEKTVTRSSVKPLQEDTSPRSLDGVDLAIMEYPIRCSAIVNDESGLSATIYDPVAHKAIAKPSLDKELMPVFNPHHLLQLINNRGPDDRVQVSAGELQSILDKVSHLNDEITLLKKEPVIPVTFTLFPELPRELRRQVWQEALHVPETITMKYVHLCRRMFENERFLAVTNSVTKSNILWTSVEARKEAKMVLIRVGRKESSVSQGSHFGRTYLNLLGGEVHIKDKGTWFNPATDEVWLPRKAYLGTYRSSTSFPGNYGIRKFVIPYQSLVRKLQDNDDNTIEWIHSYRKFGQRHLSGLVLVMDMEDLRVKYGSESVSTTSRPADFLIHEAEGVSTADFTWEMTGKEEMRKMVEWKNAIIIKRKDKIAAGCTEQELLKFPELSIDITIPTITFRLNIETLYEPK